MYPGEAGSHLLLSVPSSRQLFFGVPVGWGGMARVRADPRAVRWLPAQGEPLADPLTPFARNSNPAARASVVSPPSHPGGVPSAPQHCLPQGELVAKEPPGTLPVAPFTRHTSTHVQPVPPARGGTPITHPGTRVSPHCWPQARGNMGHMCVAHRGCHHSQEWGWAGIETDVLPLLPCGTPCPMLAHPSLDPPLPGWG